jgi:hypothetical protein
MKIVATVCSNSLSVTHGALTQSGSSHFEGPAGKKAKVRGHLRIEVRAPVHDYAFSKTVVPVKMAEQSPNDLVSRSQAKRLLLRIDRFRTVVLDFQNVNQIGQAFADEIFRVFAHSHPGIDMQFINTNQEVLKMIRRAQSA